MDPTTSAGVGKRGDNAEGGKEEEEEGRENGDWFCHCGGQDLAEKIVERVLERERVLWAGPSGYYQAPNIALLLLVGSGPLPLAPAFVGLKS